MDDLTVVVETRSGLSPDSEEAQGAARLLQHDIKVFVGSSVMVQLKPEGGVERSQGKAKRVLDQRGR
jgi:phenylacetate-CoA ligase